MENEPGLKMISLLKMGMFLLVYRLSELPSHKSTSTFTALKFNMLPAKDGWKATFLLGR